MTSKKYDMVAFKNYGSPAAWMLHKRQILNTEADFAFHFIERWGMVGALPDGEDSAGRQKLRVATPEELVVRATEMAATLWAEFEKRGWIEEVPSIEEAEVAADEQRKREKANDTR